MELLERPDSAKESIKKFGINARGNPERKADAIIRAIRDPKFATQTAEGRRRRRHRYQSPVVYSHNHQMGSGRKSIHSVF
jgi:hypothetical protein